MFANKSKEFSIVFYEKINDINGEATLESVVDDARRVIQIYSPKNISHVIIDEKSEKIVAVCIAGTGYEFINELIEVADICVLPSFRGRSSGVFFDISR